MYCIEVHVTLLGLFGHPRSDSAPGESCPLAPLFTFPEPLIAVVERNERRAQVSVGQRHHRTPRMNR